MFSISSIFHFFPRIKSSIWECVINIPLMSGEQESLSGCLLEANAIT